jgi:hypothetical protein
MAVYGIVYLCILSSFFLLLMTKRKKDLYIIILYRPFPEFAFSTVICHFIAGFDFHAQCRRRCRITWERPAASPPDRFTQVSKWSGGEAAGLSEKRHHLPERLRSTVSYQGRGPGFIDR